MITVVVPDELQPGDVLAVPSPTPSHRAHPTSQRTPGLTRTLPPPGRGLDGGPPCSHAHPHACPAPPKRTERLHFVPCPCSLCSPYAGHRAAQAQDEAERRGSEAAAAAGAGRAAAAGAAEPRLGGRSSVKIGSKTKRAGPRFSPLQRIRRTTFRAGERAAHCATLRLCTEGGAAARGQHGRRSKDNAGAAAAATAGSWPLSATGARAGHQHAESRRR